MSLNSKILKETIGQLSLENVSDIRKNFPNKFNSVKSWGFHTAGSVFVDYVRELCGIDKEKAKPTYDIMRTTGNTGAVSSLQLIKESINEKILSKGDIGGIVDYGWEGADAFLYTVK